MSAIGRVLRGEGLASAARRTGERIADALRDARLRANATFTRSEGAAILNLSAWPIATRFGGVQVQLRSRLGAERAMRSVALLHPGGLLMSRPRWHTRAIHDVRHALDVTGAKAIHLENTDGAPLESLMHLGVPLVVSIHDFSLFCARPHLVEEPIGRFCDYSQDLERCARCLQRTARDQAEHRARGRALLESAASAIFPSRFLLERHRELFSLPLNNAVVIAPGIGTNAPRANPGRAIAYVGAVKQHKGAHLLPQLIRDDAQWHIFGGGDEALLRALRGRDNVTIHGYYRGGELPSLLVRHGIGLVVTPSIWPETFGLVLSEAWLAGVPVAAFDLGAPAERIREHGGGWLTPLASGADGLAQIIDEWRTGHRTTIVPRDIPTNAGAARTHIQHYESLGLL
ncbi:MAG TPA: glycosyltransferase [Thermoanaerobaculia bacterium]